MELIERMEKLQDALLSAGLIRLESYMQTIREEYCSEKHEFEAEIERLRPLAGYGLTAYKNTRLIFLDDPVEVFKRIEALEGEQ